MAIEFNCPHCLHPYKLKEEFAGKRATCKNPDCRQVITIPKPISLPPEKMHSAADLEAAALSALSDEPVKQEKPAEQVIEMTCAYCEHKWTEPFSKAGKNTLCPNPECRQRVKVPEPKANEPVDWRQTKTKLPSGAKQNFEKLEGVEDAAEGKMVSGEALRKADATGIEIEPRSLKEKAIIGLFVVGLIAGIFAGIMYLTRTRTEGLDDRLIAGAQKGFEESSKEMPPNEAGLRSVLMNTASGEYYLRCNTPEKLSESHNSFVKAHKALNEMAPSPEMQAVAVELALSVIALGGNDEQVKQQIRFRWQPTLTGGKLKVNERVFTAQDELRKVLMLLGTADFDFRISATRRLTRELVKRGQAGVAVDIIPIVLFSSELEQDEARAVVALEIYRLDKGSELVKKIAEDFRSKIAAALNPKGGGNKGAPIPPSAYTLIKVVLKEALPGILGVPPAVGPVPDPIRIAWTGIYLLENNPEEALKLAIRPDSPWSQLRALVLCAEWAPSPVPALEAAQKIIDAEKNRKPPTLTQSQSSMLRLSQIAATAGLIEPAKSLANSLINDGLKTWALGDAVHLRLATRPKEKADPSLLELPEDEKKLRAGHAWGMLWIARHNTYRSGDRSDESKATSTWPGPMRPFGLAGVALGLQDGKGE